MYKRTAGVGIEGAFTSNLTARVRVSVCRSVERLICPGRDSEIEQPQSDPFRPRL